MNQLTPWLWKRLPLPRRARTALIWLLSPKFTVGVVGLVRDERGHVLLLRHAYRPNKPWGPPGGGLKIGESLEECLQREVREETGMEVEVDALLTAAAHFDRRLVDMIFACHPRRGQNLSNFRPNAEIAEARYFPPDRLAENMSRSQRNLIKVALRQMAGDRSLRYEPEQGEIP